MGRVSVRSTLFFFVIFAVGSALTQTTTNPLAPPPAAATPQGQAPPPKPPDMVCFGYGPNWSIQFVSWGARYLGINQPDQDFLGQFVWVAQDKTWAWQRQNGLAPMNGQYDLSATIKKASCNDPVRKETFPYSSQVNLPSGDMVSGCCRKLRAGEAPVGPHGVPPQPQQPPQ
jgi:uncharacterized membrane protein